jgi:hypothetical protein
MGNIRRAGKSLFAGDLRGDDGNSDHPSGQREKMSKFWQWFRYPTGTHEWRWRFLGIWIIFFTIIVAWTLNQLGNQSDRGIDLATKNRAANARQERTIRLLCDDLYIVNNLVTVQIEAAQIRYRDHAAKHEEAQAQADAYIIRNFDQFSREISSQITDKDSPCVSP